MASPLFRDQVTQAMWSGDSRPAQGPAAHLPTRIKLISYELSDKTERFVDSRGRDR